MPDDRNKTNNDKLRQYQREHGFATGNDNSYRIDDNRGYSNRDNQYRAQGNGGFRQEQNIQKLPDGYLENGYLEQTEKGNRVIRKELLLGHAEAIGRTFAEGRRSEELKYSQLRKFYDHAVNCEKKLKLCDDFEVVRRDIQKLNGFADYARSRKTVPEIFRTFIQKNVNSINTMDDFRKGFMEHFQAVVACYRYYRPDND